jgi:hypothetical protein
MKWRVMVELTGSDGIVRLQEVNAGGSNASECSAGTVGLLLADGKRTLAGLQDHLVRAQVHEYCRQRLAAHIAGRNGHSRISACGGCCLCSEQWRFERHVICPASVR